ncbi:hypothetical protein K490DRAFT_65597 [Saccharata proteae CBS 121410]|uniref:Uncharacterized protein n=1 Tax=Saccharata proteae CBS 121410 TaxID=1314787 RepID=A0A9P4HXM4_9PEZI|nr:hypothetical protein K490DRAFT_65597 [Saccharata proteae CBS 121410]
MKLTTASYLAILATIARLTGASDADAAHMPIRSSDSSIDGVYTPALHPGLVFPPEFSLDGVQTRVFNPGPVITTKSSLDGVHTPVLHPGPVVTAGFSLDRIHLPDFAPGPVITTDSSIDGVDTTVLHPGPVITTESSLDGVYTPAFAPGPVIATEPSIDGVDTPIFAPGPVIITDSSLDGLLTSPTKSVDWPTYAHAHLTAGRVPFPRKTKEASLNGPEVAGSNYRDKSINPYRLAPPSTTFGKRDLEQLRKFAPRTVSTKYYGPSVSKDNDAEMIPPPDRTSPTADNLLVQRQVTMPYGDEVWLKETYFVYSSEFHAGVHPISSIPFSWYPELSVREMKPTATPSAEQAILLPQTMRGPPEKSKRSMTPNALPETKPTATPSAERDIVLPKTMSNNHERLRTIGKSLLEKAKKEKARRAKAKRENVVLPVPTTTPTAPSTQDTATPRVPRRKCLRPIIKGGEHHCIEWGKHDGQGEVMAEEKAE